jgi:hypothetical protein
MFDFRASSVAVPCETLGATQPLMLTRSMKHLRNLGLPSSAAQSALRARSFRPRRSLWPADHCSLTTDHFLSRIDSRLKQSSNRHTYEKLEPRLTYTKQSLGPISNRQRYAFSPRCVDSFLPLVRIAAQAASRRSLLPADHCPLTTFSVFACLSLACPERSRRVTCHSSPLLRGAP